MARHKDYDWNLPDPNPRHQWESIHTAVLMDIRDELQKLNALLGCQNFIGIPTTLRSIRRAMPRRRVKKS